MTVLQQVKRLFKISRDAALEAVKLQRNCQHQRIWVKEQPDNHCGWSVSKKCADCGKPMGCSTITRASNDSKPKRYLVKKEQKS